ncbi:MAG: hypothetical protein SGILL_007432, partial [Bacillariaceae sp.]
MDILCGRGRTYLNHPGNKNFVATVRSKVPEYAVAMSRLDKSAVVASMVQELAEAGVRFLRFNKKEQEWEHLSQEQIHEKASHAVRDTMKYHGSETKLVTTKKHAKTAKKQQQKSKKRRSSSPVIAATTIAMCCMEPLNALTQSFVAPKLSVGTSDILSSVLKVQEELSMLTAAYSSLMSEPMIPTPPASFDRVVTMDADELELSQQYNERGSFIDT